MVIIYVAGAISAAVVIGILAYLYRESAAIDRQRQQTAEDVQAESPSAQAAQPAEMEAEPDENEGAEVGDNSSETFHQE